MSDQSQNGPQDPNAPKDPQETGAPETPQAAPGGDTPFYRRPPFMAGVAIAIVAIFAVIFLVGPSGDTDSDPEAKAEATGDLATNEVADASSWELGRPGDIVMGSPNAPVKLVEYASLTCGHCAAFKLAVFPDIKKKYIDTGLVQYTMREFPTPPVSLSIAGFMLARCTGEQRYYQALEALFRTQPVWIKRDPQEARNQLAKISRQFGLNDAEFEACIENDDEYQRIRTVVDAGSEIYGINSTPSFVINGRKAEVRSATFEALDSVIQEHLPEGTEVPEYTPAGGEQTEPGQPEEDTGSAGEEDGAAEDEGTSEDGTADEGTSEEGASEEGEDGSSSEDGASEEDTSDEGSSDEGTSEEGASSESEEGATDEGASDEGASEEGASEEGASEDDSTDSDSDESGEEGTPEE